MFLPVGTHPTPSGAPNPCLFGVAGVLAALTRTFPWTAAAGDHQLRVRATDGTGTVQTQARAEPFPDGASGWHTVAVSVA
jgi:hypothetical protein